MVVPNPKRFWQTSDNQFRMVTTYGTAQAPLAVVEGFDGKVAWKKANTDVIRLKSDEAALIELEAKLAFAKDLRDVLNDLRYRKNGQPRRTRLRT